MDIKSRARFKTDTCVVFKAYSSSSLSCYTELYFDCSSSGFWAGSNLPFASISARSNGSVWIWCVSVLRSCFRGLVWWGSLTVSRDTAESTLPRTSSTSLDSFCSSSGSRRTILAMSLSGSCSSLRRFCKTSCNEIAQNGWPWNAQYSATPVQ